jgi:hypothetical protein
VFATVQAGQKKVNVSVVSAPQMTRAAYVATVLQGKSNVPAASKNFQVIETHSRAVLTTVNPASVHIDK